MKLYSRADPPVRMPLDRKEVLPFPDIDPFTFTPSGGFLEDLVNFSLGYETTNAFSFWTGVHLLSSMFKRDLYLPWGTEKLYPNFFLILLAYPARVKKSTTLRIASPIYDMALEAISNPAMRWRKQQELLVSSTATANGMFKLLGDVANKTTKEFADADGNELEIMSDANLIIRVSEFTTLFNKAQYNANLVDKVTDFYDCKDYDNSTTVAHGNLQLENIFCTMLGATTPSAFQASMTTEAYGGGFMSRCVVVKEEVGFRKYPLPTMYPGVPSQVDMASRLAYLGEHAVGGYKLTGDAYDAYAAWYDKFKDTINEEDPDETLHQDNRRDINVLKLALVLAAQDYSIRREIRAEDINRAVEILDFTLARAADDVQRAAMNPDNILSGKVLNTIMKAGAPGVNKSKLLQNHSRLINATKMNEILSGLHQAELIDIRDSSDGTFKYQFDGHHEIYIYRSS